MGSLMAGWSTSPKNTSQQGLRRANSVTNVEVDRFWRVKRRSIQEHLEEAQQTAGLTKHSIPSKLEWNDDNYDIQPSARSLPTTPKGPKDIGITRRADWWTKSKWAYLNEPPLTETGKQNKYTAQFDVAMTKGSKDVAPAKVHGLISTKSSGF